MIRKLLHRVFRRRAGRTDHRPLEPARLGPDQHGIRAEQISSAARRTCAALQAAGHQAYVVGGAVRDLIAGVPPKDFDVATDATPEQVIACFRRARAIGRRFRIVHVMHGRETVEVSTFRSASDAETDETGRIVCDNIFGVQRDDAMRRDFTINALYYDPSTQIVVDYHHGVADLKQKTLRIIGDPATRYREDPIRMLRAVRLSAKLGLDLDPAARAPIRALAPLLENVPPARLLDELLKLLLSGHAIECIDRLREEGLHSGVLPLLDSMLANPAGARFLRTALSATDQRVQAGKSVSPGFLFAALLWQQLVEVWTEHQADGTPPQPALVSATHAVLEQQSEALAITRKIASDITEIWLLQPRFLQRSGRRPFRLLEQPRFRAAYDFLLLRAEAGELDPELPEWWDRFAHAGETARADMLIVDTAAKPRRPRRRRKTPGAGAEAETAGGAHGEASAVGD